MKTIAILNQKGGTGKTTTAINLASGLAYSERKTLLVDMDPQSHSSIGLDQETDHPEQSTAQIFTQRGLSPLQLKVATYINHLDLVPSHIALASRAEEMYTKIGKETYLKESLNRVAETYDYTVLDCPPNLGILTINALAAADFLIVPCQVSRYSLDGLSDLMGVVREVYEAGMTKNETEPRLLILLTMFDVRNKITNDFILDQLQPIKDQVLQTVIMKNESLNQAQITQESIFDFDPKSKGAKNYQSLTEEILQYE